MNTNITGNITELQCILYFTKLGYQVSLPYGGQARYDFILDLGIKLLKIQVKTPTTNDDNDYIEIECCNSHLSKGKYIKKTYTENDVDYFATFFNNTCYLIPANECNTCKKLRFTQPKNNQKINVYYAKDYEASLVLK